MGQVKLSATVISVEGDISPETFRVVGDAIGRAFHSYADTLPPHASLPISPVPALTRSIASPEAEESNSTKPRKTRQKRRPRSSGAETGEPSNSDVGTGFGGKQTMADRIAEFIRQRGPLSTTRLAQLLANGESQVAIAIGKSKGRFIQNGESNWIINPSRA